MDIRITIPQRVELEKDTYELKETCEIELDIMKDCFAEAMKRYKGKRGDLLRRRFDHFFYSIIDKVENIERISKEITGS